MLQTNWCRHAGMSLIEVLVAILIFSFGIVGLIGLQARALQYSTSAEDTSRAALLANELATAIVVGQTTPRTQLVPPAAEAAWRLRLPDTANGGLPNVRGTVTLINATTVGIKIEWRPVSAPVTATLNKYETQVIVP
jgi:type IV pilus assembly protein PilV